MADDEVTYLPYEIATGIVAAIQEEEHLEKRDKRVLTVYNHEDKEICWFDYDELMEIVKPGKRQDAQEEVQNYILRHIPDWALKI